MDILGKDTTNVVHTIAEQASLIKRIVQSIQDHTDLIRSLNEAQFTLKKEKVIIVAMLI